MRASQNTIIISLLISAVLIGACSMFSGLVPPTATPVPTATLVPTATPIPTETSTPLPPTETPTPTPATPGAPDFFQANASCKKVTVKHTEEIGGYLFYWLETNYDFIADLSWDDKSDNESGFEILKDGKSIKTLDADTTEFRDTATFPQATTGNVVYTIRSFNDVGKSETMEITVQYICR